MNIFKAMAVKDVAEVTRTIPVIDFGPAFRAESGGLDAVAAQVRDACERIGFFYLAGHGVSPRIVQAAFEASREFHALPLEEKLSLKLNDSNIGYLPVNQSMQRASTVHKATRPTSTRASSSATSARPTIPTSSPAPRYAAATVGRRGTRACER